MIRVIPWNDDAALGLCRALSFAEIPVIQSEVERGIAQLWECSDARHHAYVVTRVDSTPPEWCIVAYEGSGMQTFGPLFIEAARARGMRLRAHTQSPVVERLLRRLGLQRTEVVMKVA